MRGTLAVVAAFAVACSFDATGTDPPDSPDPEVCDWQFQRRLTIDNKQPETLIDFPLLIALDDTRIELDQVQARGEDLRFYDEDGTLLAHEIERFGPRPSVWVRVPTIAASSSDNFVTMVYGNPSAADAESPADVWSAGYVGVWHLGGVPTADIRDSTANGKHGASAGAMTTDDAVGGQIGRALSFDGSDDFVAMGEHPVHEIVDMTIEAWVFVPGNVTGWRTIVEHARATDNWYGLWKNSGNYQIHFIWGAGESTTTPGEIDTDAWQYVAGVYDSGSSEARVYLEGNRDRTLSDAGSPIPTAGPLQIGSINPGEEYFDGSIDEVRISSVARSDGWIAAQHDSMTDSLVEFGDVETIDCE